MEQMNSLATGDETEVIILADKNSNPAPYADALFNLIGRVTMGPTKISIFDKNVEVVGSQSSFENFTSFFNFHESTSVDSHYHHEYYEGNSYVHPQSVPLVVSVRSVM